MSDAVKRARTEKLLKQANWQPTDGPIPGVWAKKPAGSRCLWSCRWSTPEGDIGPADLEIPNNEPRLRIINGKVVSFDDVDGRSALDWELEDVKGRGENTAAPFNVMRSEYPLFTWPFDKLSENHHGPIVMRPSWPWPEWYDPTNRRKIT